MKVRKEDSWFAARPPYAAPGRSSAPVAERRIREINRRGDPLIDRYGSRDRRRHQGVIFRRYCNLGSVSKHYIHAGDPLKTWPETSIGIPWVGVHGIDSICVVARSKDLLRLEQDRRMPDQDKIHKNTKSFLLWVWNTIISEVEDIAAPFGESRQMSSKKPFGVGPLGPCQMLHECSKSPFGVVSMIKQDSNKKVHKASRAKYDVEKAIEFLREEMESGTVFTFDKTTQAAIYAFQHLFRQEFEADEIRAFVLKNDERIGRELKQSREDRDIEEFLAIINGA